MKKINLEVCIDNTDSIKVCNEVGVERLELCSALALGGLSPSPGVVKFAKDRTDISLHAMIRPRPGDFCFSEDDCKTMIDEINFYADLEVDGIVIGILDQNFNINLKLTEKLVKASLKKDLCVTFHRAIDFVKNINSAVESLISLGVNRILTSGQRNTAADGIEVLKHINEIYGSRITIMAGSGVNPENAAKIIKETGVKDIHCSASGKINNFRDCKLSLGSSSSDLEYQVTDLSKLKIIKDKISF